MWKIFKSIIENENQEDILEVGLSDIEINKSNFEVNIPNDLLEILCQSNGQKTGTKPIFFEFKNGFNGINLFWYNFLSFDQIINTHKYIQDYTNKQIDENLIPFAKYERELGDKGSMAFTISKIDKSIYKTLFYEYDRFGTVYEFCSEKIANSLNEFLENQMLWRTLKL